MGSSNETSTERNTIQNPEERSSHSSSEDFGDSEKQSKDNTGSSESKPESKRNESGINNKSKQKRNRSKERNKVQTQSLKVIGVNAAGLSSKLQSFEKLLRDEDPSIFCIQETKLKNQIKLK